MGSERHTTARVFISATSGDLGSVREIVKQGLLTMHCLPVEQTDFGPDYRTVTQMLEERIGGCDAVVHLVGMRYGAEPDPATLPAGTARRSYTQMEADIARRLKKKLFVFVCPEDFPYDAGEPELEEQAALQRAYREEVGRSEILRTRVTNRDDVAQRVRELQLEVEKIRTQMRRQRRRGLVYGAIVILLLGALAAGVWWSSRRTLEVVQRIAQDYDPERIEANLRKRIRERAEEEMKKLDAVKDWRKVSEIEKARDQQLADVGRLLEEMHQAYEKQEVSANYALASKILAEKGVEETLQFLAAKNGERESRIASLKRGVAAEQGELRKVLREKLLAASLLEKNLQFDQAAEQYRAVIADDRTWAEPRNALASLLIQRGSVVEPAQGNRLLSEAEEMCRQTLAMTSRDDSPQDWATAQYALGAALWRQGERAKGAESQRLLGEAVAAYREALKVRTRDQSPQQWAATQNNLAGTLLREGERATGADSQRLIGEAVAAFRAALEVRTREQWPQDWAMTQNNLGTALMDQGMRASGAEGRRLLDEAVTAYRAVLEVQTREQSPQEWARLHLNLGVALRNLGERAKSVPNGEAEGPRLLGEAVAADRAALTVYTRERSPQDWAMTQMALGIALADQGLRAGAGRTGGGAEGPLRPSGPDLLGEAVGAYRAALQVYTREQLPQPWAMTQNNLSVALMEWAQQTDGEESQRLLDQAVEAIRGALGVYTREALPQMWASTQDSLGSLLVEKGQRASGEKCRELLGEAVAAYRAALEVRTREQLPGPWARTQGRLSLALQALAKLTDGEEGKKLQAEAEGIERELAAAGNK